MTVFSNIKIPTIDRIDGLVQERRNSSALAMELHLSCINPSIWSHHLVYKMGLPIFLRQHLYFESILLILPVLSTIMERNNYLLPGNTNKNYRLLTRWPNLTIRAVRLYHFPLLTAIVKLTMVKLPTSWSVEHVRSMKGKYHTGLIHA